jgi:hypothetical protein
MKGPPPPEDIARVAYLAMTADFSTTGRPDVPLPRATRMAAALVGADEPPHLVAQLPGTRTRAAIGGGDDVVATKTLPFKRLVVSWIVAVSAVGAPIGEGGTVITPCGARGIVSSGYE